LWWGGFGGVNLPGSVWLEAWIWQMMGLSSPQFLGHFLKQFLAPVDACLMTDEVGHDCIA